MKSYDVLCTGILVADLFTAPLSRMLKPGELSLVEDITLECGGCAANVVINLSKLGLQAMVLGKVGNDAFGNAVISELASKGLETKSIKVSNTSPTSKTVIMIVKGEDRRYIHATGANAELTASDIDIQHVTNSKVLYVGGYLAMESMDGEQLSHVFRLAREAGTRTILDVVVPAGATIDRIGLSQLLQYTDVFLPNSDEALLISEFESPLEQVRYFRDLGAECVVITQGSQGSIALKSNQAVQASTFSVESVDASGGGDAFTSGFIFGELNGWNLPKTITFASAMGASACRMRGCTTSTFTRQEAEEFISKHPFQWSYI